MNLLSSEQPLSAASQAHRTISRNVSTTIRFFGHFEKVELTLSSNCHLAVSLEVISTQTGKPPLLMHLIYDGNPGDETTVLIYSIVNRKGLFRNNVLLVIVL